jgi:hypothetical protein
MKPMQDNKDIGLDLEKLHKCYQSTSNGKSSKVLVNMGSTTARDLSLFPNINISRELKQYGA